MPKKTKAIKVTDRKKAWLKKVKPSAYRIETKETNKIILIVGEGQTEKLYFESFQVLTLTVEAVLPAIKYVSFSAIKDVSKSANKDA
jgi:hypothetical protein